MNLGQRRALLMVWDGLRPDMISPETTPNLHRLAADGVRFTDSHAVFPTVTRANSASIATGALPASHGLPGNSFYAPALDPTRSLSAGDVTHLYALARLRGGTLLDRPTLADRIHRVGGRSVVVGTGSTGSVFLQHPNVEVCGDVLLHPALWIGARREDVERRIGPMPPGTMPNTEQNVWFTRLIAEVFLPEVQPRLVTFWHTDPDRTQHDRGIGHVESLRSIRDADDNLGTLLAALDQLDLRDSTDVIITSDHGFSTIAGQIDLVAELVRAGLKQSAESTDVVIADGGVYVQGGDVDRAARIVAFLQEREGIGAIFRKPRGDRFDGMGTLPLHDAGIDGDLAPDILFSHDWSNAENQHGCPGLAWSSPTTKAATHGSISPWDVRNSLVAAGPSFKRGVVSDLPAGNIDITPTLLHTLGLAEPDGLDGRVLDEALAGGPDPSAIPVERRTISVESERGRFKEWVQVAEVARSRYLDCGGVER
jgi:arylsulfatase A-like enzyme